MDITGVYTFDAPPEVVFNNLTDPDRAHPWLPQDHDAVAQDSHWVRAGTSDVEVSTTSDPMRMRWRSLGSPEVHGDVRVEDAPSGGSRVHATVAVSDGIAPERVRELLEESARLLRRDVSDNFNAG
jgi:uncharacterized protein YndB with AHSA1/START domain